MQPLEPYYLNNILKSFGLKVQCTASQQVRNISIYDLYLSPGVKIRELHNFASELALVLRAKNKPHFVPVLESGLVRMEVVEGASSVIPFWENYRPAELPSGAIPTYLGSSLDGQDLSFDLAKNPHMLVAGSTGSGKSTILQLILANSLLSNNTIIYVIDTKNIDFVEYQGLDNIQFANSYSSALTVFQCLNEEMEDRYERLRNRELVFNEHIPYIVILIDEFADLIIQDKNKELYHQVLKLTQKCRAAGMYCILATQRPSIDILKGPLKANFPARIACKVASRADSRVILDEAGAELLAGNGDAIIKNYTHNSKRFQSAFTTPEEIVANVYGKREYYPNAA